MIDLQELCLALHRLGLLPVGSATIGATGPAGPAGTTDHAALTHRAYADAGHTGFSPDTHNHFVGTPYNGLALTSDPGTKTLLATSHAAGWYRALVTVRCTVAAGATSYLILALNFDDVRGTQTPTIRVFDTTGALVLAGKSGLSSTATRTFGSLAFYSDGTRAIDLVPGLTVTSGTPTFDVLARLEYLGP